MTMDRDEDADTSSISSSTEEKKENSRFKGLKAMVEVSFQFWWQFNRDILSYGLNFLNNSLSVVFHTIRYPLLWCILKLLSISRGVEQFTGANRDPQTDSSSDDQNQPKENGKTKSKKSSKRKVKKPSPSPQAEPIFTTDLETPIEDVIEEIVAEELAVSSSGNNTESKSAPRKRSKGKKVTKSTDPSSAQEADDLGYSFFQQKSPTKPGKLEKDADSSTLKSSSGSPEASPSEPVADSVGFSFLPLRKSTRKSPPTKVKIDDLPKSSLIDHYPQPQPQQSSVKRTTASEKTSPNRSSVSRSPTKDKDDYVIVNKLEKKEATTTVGGRPRENLIEIKNNESGQVVYLEVKESKKVHSQVSYAAVASGGFDEHFEKIAQIKSTTPETTINKDEQSPVEDRKEELSEEENHVEEADEALPSDSDSLVLIGSDQRQKQAEQTDEESQRRENSETEKIVRSLVDDVLSNNAEEIVVVDSEVNNLKLSEISANLPENPNPQQLEIKIEEKGITESNVDDNNSTETSGISQNTTLVPRTDDNSESKNEELASVQDNRIPVIDLRSSDSEVHTTSGVGIEDQLFGATARPRAAIKDPTIKRHSPGLIGHESSNLIQAEITSNSQQVTRIIADDEPATKIDFSTSNLNLKATSDAQQQSNKDLTTPKTSQEHIEEELDRLTMSATAQIRVLTLNDGEHQDSTLYRLQKNWTLQFRLGPSLLGRTVFLYCNYPEDGRDFQRETYRLLPWSQDEGCDHADDTALLAELKLKISGGFHFYFVYENTPTAEHRGSGFFLVDPVLKYGKNEELPLDCIQCQTVLAKQLGPFHSWESKLKVAKESGYNMIHFTPIQELGGSKSSYSLSEQLKVNPTFVKEDGKTASFTDIANLIAKLRTEWKVLSICDIVLNHTANESQWLQHHPEVTYNCQNCPYMRPSYMLDAALHQFSLEIAKGLYEDRGIPNVVETEEHLEAIRHYLHVDVLNRIKLEEMYQCDVNKYVEEFSKLARKNVTPTSANPTANRIEEREELVLIQDPQFKRLGTSIDLNVALKLYNVYRTDSFDEETRIQRCAKDFKNHLDSLNTEVAQQVAQHLHAAVENLVAGVRYFRVQQDGPKVKEISVKHPLFSRYFTDYGQPRSLEEHEEVMYSDKGRFLMAHNGWVMNSDPLKNFAAPGSNVYIRREIIAWGDSVKLRYGDKPEDCPFLWNHMRAYVEETARIFDGVRLDNCHSTPIPVAEYLLDCARKVRPDLYVVAELFTNSDMTDNIFVNRLGISSLIREAMSAWDSHEQGRLVYRYGGSPVGSFYQPRVRPLIPSIAHALFLDLTHDNPSPIEKRSVFDMLPSTALVNMACCASGSNRGYDELVPHHVHVVDEIRQYAEWAEDGKVGKTEENGARFVTRKTGIVAAKRAINDLHYKLGIEGFDQVYVDQMDPDIVAVTRHCPKTHQSYVLVAFTAFGHPPPDAANHQRGIKPLRVEGVLDEIVLEATLSHIGVKNSGSKYARSENFAKDDTWINGLTEYQIDLKQNIQPSESDVFERVDSGSPNVIQLNFKNFKPGSIAVIKVSLQEDMREAVNNVLDLIKQFSAVKETKLSKIINSMTLPDLNRALYRCDREEQDEGFGFGTYDIPNFGRLVYAGLQGFMSLLSGIRPNNDLGHPMCANLRDGNWMIDYIWGRLKLDEGTKPLGQWFEENTKSLKSIPRYLVPCYFDVVVTGLYVHLVEQCYRRMSSFVQNGSTFVKGLSLGSVQFLAYIKSANLPTLSPNLAPPQPPRKRDPEKGETVQACVTLSAGLPHFSVGYMRNWGRDTFIALRGLLLLTERYQEARYHILGYAACLRHGLIPNLLDGGRNSRFNCRDAVWWWLYCIKCYVENAPNGASILSDKVSRIFPKDDSPPQPPGAAVDQPLYDVMQEALNVHFQGLAFRERNAGRQIDEHMTDKGFNNQIGVHPETGFVFGGNDANCGTWMDKMGSSEKAGNKGKPATPRDGSAIELIGLSKAAVTWLSEAHKKGIYPYEGVQRTQKNADSIIKWTFKEWADRIRANFEKHFWINEKPVEGEPRPDLINKRGIYKDCYGASQEWTDYQLRCNFPIAMVVAPELFNPQHAWTALQQAEKHLLGPLGMKTLDPDDWAYNGDYDNSNDTDNFKLAHGFNYHQGPEWVWPVGFYLRAKLYFAARNGELRPTLANTKIVLAKHFTELQTSIWRGLPELTNTNGAYCRDSSRTQAWSMSCILEVLHDLQKLEIDQRTIN